MISTASKRLRLSPESEDAVFGDPDRRTIDPEPMSQRTPSPSVASPGPTPLERLEDCPTIDSGSPLTPLPDNDPDAMEWETINEPSQDDLFELFKSPPKKQDQKWCHAFGGRWDWTCTQIPT